MDDECVEELGRPISSLKVAELRDELAKRALTKTGNKKELTDRLRLAIQRESSQQLSGVGQQQLQQNVPPQYINAAVAMQQNPIASSYQMQPQAQLATAFTMPTINQQQYQPTMIQPLDLQQQLTDYQNQVQFVSAELQQQQHNLSSAQQFQAAEASNQPPIDMRVAQQAQKSTQPIEQIHEQSIDLSNNTKQPTLTEESVESLETQKEVCAEQLGDQPKEQLKEQPDEQPVEHPIGQIDEQSPAIHDFGESSKQTERGIIDPTIDSQPEAVEDEQINTLEDAEQQSSSSVEPTDKSNLESQSQELTEESVASPAQTNTASQSQESVEEGWSQLDQVEPSVQKTQTDNSSAEASTKKVEQNPICLKRGIHYDSAASNQGSKEKRRKWSSKGVSDGVQVTDATQANIISGGISSQKLQELIVEKTVETNVKSTNMAEAASVHDSKESELEEGQLPDTSGDSKSFESAEPDKIPENDQNISEGKKEQPEPVLEPESEPTKVLLVQNLVRPFTLMQLKEVLTKHGPMIEEKFWTDRVKSKCCVLYESIEIAQLTKESLHGQQWPTSNPKTLRVSYITEETLTQYQKSDLAKSNDSNLALEPPENGSTQPDKSIANRLGERFDDGDGPATKRLGERVTGEISTKSSNVNRDGDNSKPQELDDLFKKTISVPHLFWLPLTEGQADIRQKERLERESQEASHKSRRSPPPRRRSPPRHRSPLARRSPVRHRSPLNRRSPPRHRSPLARRSPPRHRSPMLRRSSPRRRSPSDRSTPPRRRSPVLMRRSPNLVQRSPGPIRRSPGPIRRSPGPIRRSPVLTRRSPGPIRRSPGPMRRSPGLIRRSPAPIRGSPVRRSPPRKRSSPRRRSPPRHVSPGRTMAYNSGQRRLQRPYSNK